MAGLAVFAESVYDFLDSNSIIFDVGAHHGLKTDLYLKYGCSQVVQFEPQPDEYKLLKQKYKPSKVTTLPYALSDKQQMLDLYIAKKASTISTCSQQWQQGRFKNEHWDDPIKVPSITLDQAINEYGMPFYCKIDVEGFEKWVLLGLHKKIPLVSFEFTWEFFGNAIDCIEILLNLGYTEFNEGFEERENFELENWVSVSKLLDFIYQSSDNNQLLWGDVYAK